MTPDGDAGPLERGFTSAVSREDFQGWVLGFYNEQSDGLAKLPVMLADAQIARWQSKFGRDPTDQQRSWLGSTSSLWFFFTLGGRKIALFGRR